MTGDLTIVAPRAPGADLAPHGQAGRSALARGPSRQLPHSDAGAAELEGRSAPDREQVEALRLKRLLSDPSVRVSTHHDDASGRVVLQVQQRATGQLVEQIPSERLLRLYAMIRESLVDEHA
jgi:uncharacterized FlaG/YvyC family protein